MNRFALFAALPMALAGAAALPGSAEPAAQPPLQAEFLQPAPELSWVIAAEGNRALAAIRADLRHQLREQLQPALSGNPAEPEAPLNVLVSAAATGS